MGRSGKGGGGWWGLLKRIGWVRLGWEPASDPSCWVFEGREMRVVEVVVVWYIKLLGLGMGGLFVAYEWM